MHGSDWCLYFSRNSTCFNVPVIEVSFISNGFFLDNKSRTNPAAMEIIIMMMTVLPILAAALG